MGEGRTEWHGRWGLRTSLPGQAPALQGPCPGTHSVPNLQPQQELALCSLGWSQSCAILVQSHLRAEQRGKRGGQLGTCQGLLVQKGPCCWIPGAPTARGRSMSLCCCLCAEHLLLLQPAAPTFPILLSFPPSPLGLRVSQSRDPCPGVVCTPDLPQCGPGPRAPTPSCRSLGAALWGGPAWTLGAPFSKVRVSGEVSCPWPGPVPRRATRRGRPRGLLEVRGWTGRLAKELESQTGARVGSPPVDVAQTHGARGSERRRQGWGLAGQQRPLPHPTGQGWFWARCLPLETLCASLGARPVVQQLAAGVEAAREHGATKPVPNHALAGGPSAQGPGQCLQESVCDHLARQWGGHEPGVFVGPGLLPPEQAHVSESV